MRIMHYMFGIPPVRTGGLVRYATDLMKQEIQMGQEVFLLIPGEIPAGWRKKPTVIYRRKQDYLKIPTYVIYNPLPVPMCNGILDIEMYTRKCTGKGFRDFLRRIRPQLIHIHTFMGLHREFLAEAQKLGIPSVFTTHDYFGICPKADLMFEGALCMDDAWENCGICSRTAFSEKRLRLEQMGIYRFCRKQKWLVKLAKRAYGRFRMIRAGQLQADEIPAAGRRVPVSGIDYAGLKKYYASMFRMISWFHYNSALAEELYTARLEGIRGTRILVSHSMVRDSRRKRRYGRILRLGYFGSWTEHKGFYDLLDACRLLYGEGCTNLELHVYSGTGQRREGFVRNHPDFRPDQLGEVMDAIDVLVVPSKWPETFGLVVLEALSFAVPVIISKYVGAGDILSKEPEAGFVYDGTMPGLKKQLKLIYDQRTRLKKANQAILEMEYDFSYQGHAGKILHMYQEMVAEHGDI